METRREETVGDRIALRSTRIKLLAERATAPNPLMHCIDTSKVWAAVTSLYLPGRWELAGAPRIHMPGTAIHDGNRLRCQLTVISTKGERYRVRVNDGDPFDVSKVAMAATEAETRSEVWHSERHLIDPPPGSDKGPLSEAFDAAFQAAKTLKVEIERVVIDIHQTNSPCATCQGRLAEAVSLLRKTHKVPMLVRASAEQRYDKSPGTLGPALHAVDLRFGDSSAVRPASGTVVDGQVPLKVLNRLTGVHLRTGGKFEMDGPRPTTGDVIRGRSGSGSPSAESSPHHSESPSTDRSVRKAGRGRSTPAADPTPAPAATPVRRGRSAAPKPATASTNAAPRRTSHASQPPAAVADRKAAPAGRAQKQLAKGAQQATALKKQKVRELLAE